MAEPSEHDSEEVGGGVSDLWLIVAGTFEASEARLYMPIEGATGLSVSITTRAFTPRLGDLPKQDINLASGLMLTSGS